MSLVTAAASDAAVSASRHSSEPRQVSSRCMLFVL